MGVLLYAMVCGTVPFKASTMSELHKLILRGNFNLPEHLSPEVCDILIGMINIIPNARMGIKEILAHDWFKSNRIEEISRPPRFVGRPDNAMSRHGFLDDRVQIDKNLVLKV